MKSVQRFKDDNPIYIWLALDEGRLLCKLIKASANIAGILSKAHNFLRIRFPKRKVDDEKADFFFRVKLLPMPSRLRVECLGKYRKLKFHFNFDTSPNFKWKSLAREIFLADSKLHSPKGWKVFVIINHWQTKVENFQHWLHSISSVEDENRWLRF